MVLRKKKHGKHQIIKKKKKIFAGSNLESTRWSGSLRHDLPLTFGVELEVFLVYDKSSYQRDEFMNKVKNGLAEEIERVHREVPAERQIWHIPETTLWVAREILRREGLDVAGLGYIQPENSVAYSGWNLVNDTTISCDDPRADTLKYIPERFDEQSLAHGAGGGVELISRKLPAPNSDGDGFAHPSLAEVRDYVVALRGRDTDHIGCLPNESCGLHVHVGVAARRSPDMSVMFPLGVLQHLCYIILQYETVISWLFPPSRRAQDHSKVNWLNSNLMGLRKTRHVCDCYTDIFSEDRLYKIEERIFAPNMTIDRLSDMMSSTPRKDHREGPPQGTRYKFVNFENLSSANREDTPSLPMTIEFRQHESTLDSNTVNHWIIQAIPPSNTNLKRLRTYAQRQGQKYKMVSRVLDGQIDDLFSLLAFKDHQRDYWLDRLKRFNPEEFSSPPISPTLDLNPESWSSICPECHGQNKLAVEDGELRIQLEVERRKQIERIRVARERRRKRKEGLVVEEGASRPELDPREERKIRRRKAKLGKKGGAGRNSGGSSMSSLHGGVSEDGMEI